MSMSIVRADVERRNQSLGENFQKRHEPVYATVNRDIRRYKSKIKQLTEENLLLTNQVKSVVMQQKWKEGNVHAGFQLQITELETETRSKVGALHEHLKTITKENQLLNNQIDILRKEKSKLSVNCRLLENNMTEMISPSHHNEALKEHKKLSEEQMKKHIDKGRELQQQCQQLEGSNAMLETQLLKLEEKLSLLQTSNSTLIEEKCRLVEQIEDYKTMEQNSHKLMSSLLKTAEELAVERDVLLSKTSFQDNQQNQLYNTMLGFSLNIGRLTEHISSIGKKNISKEVIKSKSQMHSPNAELLYSKHMDILRETILNQNTALQKLQDEKRLLEKDVHSRIIQTLRSSNS